MSINSIEIRFSATTIVVFALIFFVSCKKRKEEDSTSRLKNTTTNPNHLEYYFRFKESKRSEHPNFQYGLNANDVAEPLAESNELTILAQAWVDLIWQKLKASGNFRDMDKIPKPDVLIAFTQILAGHNFVYEVCVPINATLRFKPPTDVKNEIVEELYQEPHKVFLKTDPDRTTRLVDTEKKECIRKMQLTPEETYQWIQEDLGSISECKLIWKNQKSKEQKLEIECQRQYEDDVFSLPQVDYYHTYAIMNKIAIPLAIFTFEKEADMVATIAHEMVHYLFAHANSKAQPLKDFYNFGYKATGIDRKRHPIEYKDDRLTELGSSLTDLFTEWTTEKSQIDSWVKEFNDKKGVFYTIEEEADQYTPLFMFLVGLNAKRAVESQLQVLKYYENSGIEDPFRGKPGYKNAADCENLYRNNWKDARKKDTFVVSGIGTFAHFQSCFRMWSMAQEIKAHGYKEIKYKEQTQIATDWNKVRTLAKELLTKAP